MSTTQDDSPRKRPLSEIHNKPFVLPKRRDSLTAPLTLDMRKSTLHKGESTLPVLSNINMDTYLNLKQKLKAVQPLQFERQLPKQAVTDEPELDQKILELSDSKKNLQGEISTIIREQHKLRKKILELNELIASQKRVLGRELEKSNKDKAKKEQMLLLQIQELEIKLQEDFKELEFHLASALAEVRNFKDEDGRKAIDILKQDLDKEVLKIESSRNQNDSRIKNEALRLKNDLENYIKNKESETEQLASEFEAKEESLNSVNKQLVQLQDDVKRKLESNNLIKSLISKIESTMNDFPNLKTKLLNQLNQVDDQLLEKLAVQAKLEADLEIARKTHSVAVEKLTKQDAQRRTLENSIMDYEGKLRVYVQAPRNKKYHFNKWFGEVADEYISDESSCLTNLALKGNDISVFITGDPTRDFIVTSISNIYRHLLAKANIAWEYNFKFQLVSITDEINDLLNTIKVQYSAPDKLQSQQMILDDIEEFRSILYEKEPSEGVQLFVIKVEGTNGERKINSNIMVFDMTANLINEQVSQLKSFDPKQKCKDGIISNLFRYCYKHSKCLFISRLKVELAEMLDVLTDINLVDSGFC